MQVHVQVLEGIVSQLSRDLSHAELELKAAASKDCPSTSQQALTQQVKALTARVGSEAT